MKERKRCLYCRKIFLRKSNHNSWERKIYCSNFCLEKHRRTDKERIKRNREISLKYYYNHKKEIIEYQIARIERLRKENPEFHKKYNIRHNSCHRISLRKKICEICKERKAEHRHHPNYSKPKEIVLVCKSCHDKIHKNPMK